MTEIYYTVYFLFIISIIIIFLVWHSNLHRSAKYRSLLNLITALTILFTSFAIIIQLYTFNATQSDTEIQFYETLFKSLIDDTITYFENNPKMTYYYNEIFKPLNYNKDNPTPPKKRLYAQEQQITYTILQELATIVYYISNDKTITSAELYSIKSKLNNFINNLVDSPIFIENYEHFKPEIYSVTLRNYLQQNFNI